MSQTPARPHRILIVGDSAAPEVLARARVLPDDGMMICIDGDRAAAARAAEQFAREGLQGRASVMIGDPALFVRKVSGPFDLIVIVAGGEARDRIAAHVPRLAAPGARVEYGWQPPPA